MRPQCLRCVCVEMCDAAERDAETQRDDGDYLPSDADWLADRAEARSNR